MRSATTKERTTSCYFPGTVTSIESGVSNAAKFKFMLQPNTGHDVTPEAFQEAIGWLEQWLKPNGRQ
jgi:hypothetical protein